MNEVWPVGVKSPLTLDGWLEFNHYKWGVKPLNIRLTEKGKELPAIEAVLYLDAKGRIVQPPLNPYLPVAFYPTPSNSWTRLYRQWMSVSECLVQEFIKRGQKGSLAFPPELIDVRQWQWSGFLSEVRYTFYVSLPYDLELADYSQHKQLKKALKTGFVCEVAPKHMCAEVIACLAETEVRQQFAYRIDAKDLETALHLLGEEILRIYVCKSATNEVASARVVINAPGSIAIDWVAGTKKKFLSSGATQLLIYHALTDVAQEGAIGFDFAGANLPTVSTAKAEWGGRLMPYYAVRPLNLRTVGVLGYRMLRQRKRP